ncbi:MAG: hypothetical protein JMN25_06635 [gamma proteobacterium endosymbiont of Lamellibrachia anaximandri]|nr:hypothetical protein [gamma proteobacterium endosymbiont of Lamellibrachia anaximandri]
MEEGLARFQQALEKRPYLRTLARRPIFLTMMSSVHVSRTRMPEGRADLYGAIIELYLVRQESNRRRRYTLSGGDMPHWPEDEPERPCGLKAAEAPLIAAIDQFLLQ